jgi:hypothetical protein
MAYKFLSADTATWDGSSAGHHAVLADVKRLAKAYVFLVEQEARDR